MELIEYGKYYHIYNRGINRQKIFKSNCDYLYFLNILSIFADPTAEIYSYALMSNHFHLVLKIKENKDIGYLDSAAINSKDLKLKWKTYFVSIKKQKLIRKPVPKKMIQHFFSTYAKYFNKKYKRTGALFEHPYKRIIIEDEEYLKQLVIYTHLNPIKHGYCQYPSEYRWTSYNSYLSSKPTKLQKETIINLFGDVENFKSMHFEEDDFDDLNNLLLE